MVAMRQRYKPCPLFRHVAGASQCTDGLYFQAFTGIFGARDQQAAYPVRTKGLLDITGSPLQMGRCMDIHTGEAPIPTREDIAIITVNEQRGGDPARSSNKLDAIRKHFTA